MTAFCLAPGLACIAIVIVPSLTLVTGPGGVSSGFGLLLLLKENRVLHCHRLMPLTYTQNITLPELKLILDSCLGDVAYCCHY